MKKVVVLYHSGVNNTKIVSEKIYNHIKKITGIEIYSVERLPKDFSLNNYSGIVIGFPVIHTAPSKRILEFINKIEKALTNKPAYIFTTCGLYSGNALREFSKKCMNKNIIPVVTRDFNNCPAIDGVLLAPFIKSFYKFPKNLEEKIVLDVVKFKKVIKTNKYSLNIPGFKLYTVLNYPNKLAGQLITFPIYLHNDKCIKCNKCIINCPSKAIEKDKIGYPKFHLKKCEKCYRCIHHCPSKALSLSKKKTPEKLLGITKSDII